MYDGDVGHAWEGCDEGICALSLAWAASGRSVALRTMSVKTGVMASALMSMVMPLLLVSVIFSLGVNYIRGSRSMRVVGGRGGGPRDTWWPIVVLGERLEEGLAAEIWPELFSEDQ